MEVESHPSSPSSPFSYVTAPTTPNSVHGRSKSLEFSHSRRRQNSDNSSPPILASEKQIKSDDFPSSYFDEFDLVTSMKFKDHLIYETSQNFEHALNEECRDSVPAVAFAGQERYLDGLVMPLKLPPRLHQFDADLPVSSPPTVCKIRFARICSRWNDNGDEDFDPFMVALEKVTEEKRVESTPQHKRSRSRSRSPFRAISKCYSTDDNDDCCCNEDHCKGSACARSPKRSLRLLFRHRVRPDKSDDGNEESKVQKLKGIVSRWSRSGREYCESKKPKISLEALKQDCISKLMSFKLKGRRVFRRWK